MAVRTVEQPGEILHRLDAIYEELLALRQAVQALADREDVQPQDWVETLAGALGPAAPDELTFFNTLDVSWQRFAE